MRLGATSRFWSMELTSLWRRITKLRDQAFEHVTSYAGAAINKESRTRIDDEVLNGAAAINGTGSLSGGGSTSNVSSDVMSKYSIKQVNYDEYYPEAILTEGDNRQ